MYDVLSRDASSQAAWLDNLVGSSILVSCTDLPPLLKPLETRHRPRRHSLENNATCKARQALRTVSLVEQLMHGVVSFTTSRG